MVVTLNGVRSLRRYRLVIAQKSKLRLTQEVIAALASHSRDHRLTASGFFPCSIDRKYLYGYAGDGYRSPLWLCVPTMDLRSLFTGSGATKYTFIRPPRTEGYYSYRVSIILMLIDCNHCLLQAPALQIHLRASPLTGPEGRVRLSKIPRRTKRGPPLTVNLK